MAKVQHDGKDRETDWFDRYEILECRGCGNVTFRKRSYFSEWQDWTPDPDVDHETVFDDSYYPPLTFRDRPVWLEHLVDEMQAVLDEVYVALQNGLFALSAMGARTVVDILIRDRVGDSGSFKAGLKGLRQLGILEVGELDLLDIVTETGSAAAHRAFRPEQSDLVTVVDIIERVLYGVYVGPGEQKKLSERARELGRKIPARPRRK